MCLLITCYLTWSLQMSTCLSYSIINLIHSFKPANLWLTCMLTKQDKNQFSNISEATGLRALYVFSINKGINT